MFSRIKIANRIVRILVAPLHFVFRCLGALMAIAMHGYELGYDRMFDRYNFPRD